MMRCFVGRFFGCATCVEHFTSLYDACIFDHCKLKEDDGRGVVSWIWRFHNAVTVRVAGEAGTEPPPPWPLPTDCIMCWEDDTREDAAMLYEFIKQTYSLRKWIDAKEGKAGKFRRLYDDASPQRLALVALMLLFALILFLFRGHVRDQLSGRGRTKTI